jgi:hypothetical protein
VVFSRPLAAQQCAAASFPDFSQIPWFPFLNSRDFCGFPCSQGTMEAFFNDDLEDLEEDYFDFDGFSISGSSGGGGDPSSPVCMLWLMCCR